MITLIALQEHHASKYRSLDFRNSAKNEEREYLTSKSVKSESKYHKFLKIEY